jgi:phosphoglycolate phosphatase-like HAD superfamily hydrolase
MATKAVLFDYDDTLVQTRRCKYRALGALGSRHYSLELTDAGIDRHWGIAYHELFRALFGAVEPDLSLAISRYEALDGEFAMTAYPETRSTLTALPTTSPTRACSRPRRRRSCSSVWSCRKLRTSVIRSKTFKPLAIPE